MKKVILNRTSAIEKKEFSFNEGIVKMKRLFNVSFTTLFLIILASCAQDESLEPEVPVQQLSSSDFFKQNISIFDARVRSVENDQYVKELFLANFSDTPWDKSSIGFDGFLFEDNGRGNDLIAMDGIYTSVKRFNHNSVIPFINNQPIRSVLETPIVSPSFTRMQKLKDFSLNYQLNRKSNGKAAGPVATLECDVEICSTGCIADWIWSGFGCVCVSNCKAKIGWE